MNINGIAVNRTALGVEVSITALLAANETLEADDVARLLDILNEAAVAQKVAPVDPAPTSTRRRNGAGNGATAGAETASSQAGAEPAAPTSRRRGTAAATAPASAEPASSIASASEASASRRRRAAEPETAKAEAPKDISDADVTKAASQAAAKITPAKVTEILETFDDAEGFIVANVHDLTQTQRQDFIAKLDAACAE